jgi:formylglycine-generating enzyme required for sulfatase activity
MTLPEVRSTRALSTLLVSALAVACKPAPSPAPAPSATPAPGSASVAPTQARAPERPLRENEQVEIPTGGFLAGSVPGEPGREPDREPRELMVELGAYRIDRLPYPNRPGQAPRTGVTREEAERLCAERSARLCTELEWERACKGPNNDRYPGAQEWDPRCDKPDASCATGFDVLAMGTALAEWTASRVEIDGRPRAVSRGAARGSAAEAHRCAARTPLAPDTSNANLGFRCCSGAPNARALPEPKAGEAFRKHRLGAERLSALLGAEAATRELVKDVKFFRDPDAAETVIARGPGDRKGFSFTVAPLLWQPVAGAEFLVVTGRAGEKTSFVATYYVLGDDKYRLASSFVMKDEPGPVALAYSNDIRPRLHFSTCWGCPGETGKILFRKPERAVIVQP